MRLTPLFSQAIIGAMDAPARFSSLLPDALHTEMLTHVPTLHQNGRVWAAKGATTIAQDASPRNCEPHRPSNSTGIVERALIFISVLLPRLTRMTWTRDSRSIGTAVHACSCHSLRISLTSSKRSAWFTQDDVNQIQQAKLNTVRVPVSQVR
jgi:hypothetical protein